LTSVFRPFFFVLENQTMSIEQSNGLLVNGRKAAEIVGVAFSTWRRWADNGTAPAGFKVGGFRRWHRDELARWVSNGCPRVRPAKTTRVKHREAPAPTPA
jgi:hypothetical protein